MVAPTGFCGFFSHEGDRGLARAAAALGVPFIQSTVSNMALEDIAAVPGVRHWMQIYVFRSRPFMERLVARAAAANCEALVLTVDGSVIGNREWDRRNYRRGTDPTLLNKLEALLHPRWISTILRHGVPAFNNLADALPPGQRDFAATAAWSRRELDPDVDWDCVAWLRGLWPGKLIIKGLLSADDARLARDAGVDGIVLSNHGGRQLDGAISPMTALPEIASRYGGDMAILIDSGFRRGTDIVKALALGARGVLIGRAMLYGLAAGGEGGARRALEILKEEIERSLALLGKPSIKELDGHCLKLN
jgi:(S)-mandelate dehydrogenase